MAPEQGNSVIKYLFFARALHLQGFATNNSIELQLGAHNKTFVKKICEIFRSVFTLWYRRLLRYWRERIRIPKVPLPPTTRTTILIKLGAPRHFFPLLSHSPPKGFFKIRIFCSRHHHSESESLGGGERKETRKQYGSTISCIWGEAVHGMRILWRP